MNKETYIDALERKLWDRLDPDQLRDIISYYKDYFAMEAAKDFGRRNDTEAGRSCTACKEHSCGRRQ